MNEYRLFCQKKNQTHQEIAEENTEIRYKKAGFVVTATITILDIMVKCGDECDSNCSHNPRDCNRHIF
jgi:hypothetical protein